MMPAKYLFTSLLLLFSIYSKSQFSDNFDDGNYNSNPVWNGDSLKFEINSDKFLHLNAPAITDTAILATSCNAINSAIWEFLVCLDFNPSSGNYAQVFLNSDNPDLKDDVFGYFVRIGNTSDEVSLYRSDGNSVSEIIDGRDDIVDNDSVHIRVKVTRDNYGNWKLFSDSSGSFNYTLEDSTFDDTYINSEFFGVFCKYTSTRSDKFYFDDFSISGDAFIDSISPVLLEFDVSDSTSINLKFSEPIDSSNILNNYFKLNNLLFPIEVIQNSNLREIDLVFSNPFIPDESNILEFSGITDFYNNVINPDSFDFVFYRIEENTIIINEFMCDPNPSIGLPLEEYIEIYNTKTYEIRLEKLKIRVGSTDKGIPDFSIPANDFVIMCSSSAVDSFSQFGNCISIPSFPALTNAGTNIEILDSADKIIDKIDYEVSWYQDEIKEDGGWSIERINPENFCKTKNNWRAAISEIGGTPGSVNSVYEEYPAILALESFQFINNKTLDIRFNNPLNICNLQSFSIVVKNSGNEVLAFFPKLSNSLTVFFINEIINESFLILNLDSISDIFNQSLYVLDSFFYCEPQLFDIIITEIMADPSPTVNLPEFEFIEIFNRSEYDFVADSFSISIGNSEYSFPSTILKSGEYFILSCDEGSEQYKFYGNSISIFSSSAISNEGKEISILYKDFKLHGVNFEKNWYDNSAKADGGWSLEIIDMENFCEGNINWTASEDLSGGTPGKENSVSSSNPDKTPPTCLRSAFLLPNTRKIMVVFDEVILPVSISDVQYFRISPDNFYPVQIITENYPQKTCILLFADDVDFLKQNIYEIEFSGSAQDCSENIISETCQLQLALPDSCEAFDIVINEILFNPNSETCDFVEIFNRSTKTIDLSEIRISARNTESLEMDYDTILSFANYIFPNEYRVLTVCPDEISENYFSSDYTTFIKQNSLPSFPDDEGIIQIVNKNLQTIDEFHYDEGMHFSLLEINEGVSLEKINPNVFENGSNNWHSASSTSGFATPGIQNSQYLNSEPVLKFSIKNEVFSPDNDGYKDYITIDYSFDNAGFVADVIIFDSKGREVRYLLKNQLLGTSGNFIWNGTDNYSNICEMGIYLILIKYFDLKGNLYEEKYTCVLHFFQ